MPIRVISSIKENRSQRRMSKLFIKASIFANHLGPLNLNYLIYNNFYSAKYANKETLYLVGTAGLSVFGA